MGSLIVRSIGIAVIAGICTWKMRNVAARHAVWVAVLGAMLLMPASDYLLPASWVPVRLQQSSMEQTIVFTASAVKSATVPTVFRLPAETASPAPNHASTLDWWKVASVFYVLLAFAMLSRLVTGYWKIWKMQRAGKTVSSAVWEEITASHPIRWRTPILQECEAVRVPMTIGFLKPVVILPADWTSWDEWKLRAVLLHELAHVRRADWAIATIAAAAKCVFWLNPLSWFLERQLSSLAEQASDDAAMAWARNSTRYAEILLEFAAAAQNSGRLMKRGVAMAQHKMRSRIERVLSNSNSGTGVLKTAGWMLVLLLAVPVVYSAAALQVSTGRISSPIPQYAAVVRPSPLPEAPVVPKQAVPETVLQAGTSLPKREEVFEELWDLQVELGRRQHIMMVQQKDPTNPAAPPEPDPVITDLSNRIVALRGLFQTEVSRPLPPQGNSTNTAPADVHSLFRYNGDFMQAMRAYSNALAQLRSDQDSNMFSVSFTGIQGRVVSMKVANQDFSFGCESCSFFVGDSVVGSVTSAPPGPGIQVRLSSDGTDLSILCRATTCDVRLVKVNTDGSIDAQVRQLVNGTSESFRTSNQVSVAISKK